MEQTTGQDRSPSHMMYVYREVQALVHCLLHHLELGGVTQPGRGNRTERACKLKRLRMSVSSSPLCLDRDGVGRRGEV